MESFLLQDWTTVRAGTAITSIIQAEQGWLDLAEYQDILLWTEVAEWSGGETAPTLLLETSPVRDLVTFASIAALALEVSAAPVLSRSMVGDSPVLPLARWLRWHLTGPSTPWDVTFRVTAMANRQGG
jgi:hypothetical protein